MPLSHATIKGVVLAGGTGSRLGLDPASENKHLLTIGDRPMVAYPIECLARLGVRDIAIVTAADHVPLFREVLDDVRPQGVRSIELIAQDQPTGIAAALGLTEAFADGKPVCVALGDNLYECLPARTANAFADRPRGTRLLVTPVADGRAFGVAICADDRIARIIEKPSQQGPALAVTGLYFYDSSVFGIIRGLTPSARGELEISDVNDYYAARGLAEADTVRGWWIDAGTPDDLTRARELVAMTGANRRDDD